MVTDWDYKLTANLPRARYRKYRADEHRLGQKMEINALFWNGNLIDR